MILNELYKLNELNPDTLRDYKKAAGADATAADAAGDYARGNKRFKGIVRATKKQFANDAKGVTEGSDDKFRAADKVEELVRYYKLFDKRGWTDLFAKLAGRKLQGAPEISREMEYASKFLDLLDSIRMRSDYRGQQDPKKDQELIDLSNQWLDLFNKATSEFKTMSGQGMAEGSSENKYSNLSNRGVNRGINRAGDDFNRMMDLDQVESPHYKTQHQQDTKQRLKTKPMAGPKGVLPEQGMAEGVRDLGYDAQSLITKLRRDVEEKRLQPTRQAVLMAAKELAGDMDFAPELLVRQVLGQAVSEDDDAVAAFLSRGGEIQQLKPQRGPKRSGVSFASKHIGSASGRGNTKGKVSGLGANTGKSGKPVVTAEQGIAEGHNNSRTIIAEALITERLWSTAGRKLMEAQLTADQITQIFQQIQQDATAAGGNRTLIGKGKDAADAVSSAWTNLKDKIYNSKPMSNFASAYDTAAEKLKQATGGDAGAMKYIQKYRDFATKHPMLQSAIYAALIAASGITGVGIAGAAVLGLFKLFDQAIQGKDIRSAMWSGVKTGAQAFAAGQIGQALKGQPAGGGTDVSGFGIEQGLSPEQIQTLKNLGASGKKMVIQGGELWYEGPNGLVMFTTPDGSSAEAMLKVAQGAGSQAGQAVSSISGYDKIETGKFGDFGQSTYNLQPLQDMASDPNLSPIAQDLAAKLAAGKEVNGVGEYLRKAMAVAAQKSSIIGDMPDGSANAGMRTFMSLQNLQKAIDDAGLMSTLKESVTLSESQIFFVIGKIVERHRKLDEGIMDTIKGAAGKAVGSVVNYARTKGTNLTTKITADKLLQAWKKAGSPMDSATVAKVIQDAGVPAASVQQAYSTMKIPFDAAPAAPVAPAAAAPAAAAPAAPAAAAGKFPGEDPQGAGYVGSREVARRQAARAAGAAKPAPAKTPDYSRQSTGYSGGTYTMKQPAAPAAQPGIPSTGTSNSVFGRTSTSSTGGISQPTATGLRHTAKANNPNQPAVAEAARQGEYGRVLTALGLYYPDKFSMEELNTPGWHKVIANKADVPVEYAGQVINDFTRPGVDDEDDEQGLNEFAPGAGGDDDIGDDPYKYPNPKRYNRSADYFEQFEADHFDREDFDDDTGVFKGYWGSKQIAYFKFDNPARTGGNNPGMGWYYEPQSSSSDNSTAAPAADRSDDRKQQELGMIRAFLKSGNRPNPDSQIGQLMKKHGMTEGLNEFALPGNDDDGNDGFSDDTLRQLAAQWYNGDEDPKVEQTLMAAGWEIGQDEGYDDEPGVFVVQAGDINGRSYMSWPATELEVLSESAGDELQSILKSAGLVRNR